MSLNLVSSAARGHLSPLNTAWFGTVTDVWWWYVFTSGGTSGQSCSDTVRTTFQGLYGYNQNIRG